MTLTQTNLDALTDTFRSAVRVPNSLTPNRATHIRRAVSAGLVTVDTVARELVLTEAGAAIVARRSK